MFLLIQRPLCNPRLHSQNLHSTMFLLILSGTAIFFSQTFYLHSTMFLLIQWCQSSKAIRQADLHSTMFLLIPVNNEIIWSSDTFTFHNVSINSRYSIFLIFPTFSLLFLSTLDSICVFFLYSHLKIIIYLLFMPLSMSPVFYFIEHRQFYNFIFLTAYAISFNFLNVYSYFSTYQQTHCNIIKLQLRIIFFILNRL